MVRGFAEFDFLLDKIELTGTVTLDSGGITLPTKKKKKKKKKGGKKKAKTEAKKAKK